MSDVEDIRLGEQVRASMRAHDGAAPRAVDLPDILGAAQARPDARFSWAPLAAAAVIVAILVGTAIALNVGKHYGDPSAGERVDGNNVLLCPGTYQTRHDERGPIWTPTKPNHVPARHQLVPNETPAHAVVCSYVATRDGSPMPTAVPLSGRKILGGRLGAITDSLAAQPEGTSADTVCFQSSGADGMNYLIGLTYESGTLWVSAPGDDCRGASNGTFTTPVNLRPYARAAFDTGQWVSDPPQEAVRRPSACTATGRLGQDRKMVPGTPTSVLICADGTPVKTATAAHAAPLIAALNALPVTTPLRRCRGGLIAGATPGYQLVFGYPAGPDVAVAITHAACAPITNGALVAGPETAVRALIARL